MADWMLDEDEPLTTRMPPRGIAPTTDDDDDDAPLTLRSPESGIVVRPRASPVTFAPA